MDPQPLSKIVDLAHKGGVLLPDFQRDFVWQPEQIRELLTSIFQGYYIGTFLFLEAATKKPLFQTRPIAGAPKPDGSRERVKLVLDGQQRISALYYSIHEPELPLRNKKNPTRFYVDVALAERGDIDDAVKHYSTHGKAYRQVEASVAAGKLVPVRVLAREEELDELIETRKSLGKHRKVLRALGRALATHPVHIIELDTDDMDNIVNVFERTNRTGLRLGMFDLAVARSYAKDVNLRNSWDEFRNAHPAIAQDTDRDVPLKVMALANKQVPKAREIFALLDDLERDEIEAGWDGATSGLVAADQRLKNTYGAISQDLVPYSPMVLPLAALLEHLSKKKITSASAFEKIDTWYWASLLTERYDAGGNTTALEDVNAVVEWIKSGTMPEWLEQLTSGFTQVSPEFVGCTGGGLWRTAACLFWAQRPRDFMNGQELTGGDLDHVFPGATMKGQPERDWVVNRAPLSEDTNRRLKQAKTPSAFFKQCLAGHGNNEPKLLATLQTHLISERAYRSLLNDNFLDFTREREKAIIAALRSRASLGAPKK